MAINLETLSYDNSEVLGEVKNDLKSLKEEIKDQSNFENLSNDPLLKKGLQQIFYRGLDSEIRSFEKSHEKILNNVDKYTADIIKDHPDLVLFVRGDLNLPIRTEESGINFRFVDLSTEQKLNFIALAEVVSDYTGDGFKNVGASDIMDKYQKHINKLVEKAVQDLNTEINKSKNIAGSVNLRKILKQKYWLTDDECKIVEKYIKIIDNHPEYVGLEKTNIINKAGAGGYIFFFLMGIGLGALGMHYINRIGKISPETTNTVGETVIEEPEAILFLLTQKWRFETSGSIKKQLFTESKDPNSIVETGKNLIKRGINLFETKELTMEMAGDLGLKYDLDGSSLTVNHETGEIILRVKKPNVVIIDSSAEITNSNGEIFEMQAFRNAEMELETNLKKQAIDKVKNNPLFYNLAKEQTEEDLKKVFAEIQPYGVDVTSVKVEYIETIEKPVE